MINKMKEEVHKSRCVLNHERGSHGKKKKPSNEWEERMREGIGWEAMGKEKHEE
jgi:hypothetical protein